MPRRAALRMRLRHSPKTLREVSMRIGHTLFRVALLGSTLAVAAFITSAHARESRADRERILAATGKHSSALPARAAAVFSPASRSATYTVLHNFAGGTSDGSGS